MLHAGKYSMIRPFINIPFFLLSLYLYHYSSPYGMTNDGYIPVHLSSWGKMAIDWLNCTELTESGIFTLGPAASTTDCFMIMLVSEEDTGFDEYLLVENRQQTNFDINFWEGGIVIYHIDDAANEQYDRGFPGQRGWPANNVSGSCQFVC